MFKRIAMHMHMHKGHAARDEQRESRLRIALAVTLRQGRQDRIRSACRADGSGVPCVPLLLREWRGMLLVGFLISMVACVTMIAHTCVVLARA
jgi:hypothetical protein